MSDYAAPDAAQHVRRPTAQYPQVRGPVPQQQQQQQGSPVGARAPVVNTPVQAHAPTATTAPVQKKTAAERQPQHAKGIEYLVPLQVRRVTFRITGTPAQMESGDAHIQRLGEEVVETWKQATSLKNRHLAYGEELEGDPTKTVISQMRVCTRSNEFDEPLDLTIDYFMPHSAVAGAQPCTVHIPTTKGVPLQDNGYVVKQTTHTVTDRMLGFEGLMEGAELDIIPDRNPNKATWNIRAWDSETNRPTFAICLLKKMLDMGQFPGQKSIHEGINRWFMNPQGHEQVSLPKEMVKTVEEQIYRGQREIKSSMADLHKLTATFRPTYGSWSRTNVSGADVGTSMANARNAESSAAGVIREAYVECEFTYGMLKSKKKTTATESASL